MLEENETEYGLRSFQRGVRRGGSGHNIYMPVYAHYANITAQRQRVLDTRTYEQNLSIVVYSHSSDPRKYARLVRNRLSIEDLADLLLDTLFAICFFEEMLENLVLGVALHRVLHRVLHLDLPG